ncbi:MAG: hypothetical protein PHQ40_06370 [Anaerolineaceae bacterium]|nr:hypothetical protein [Anaerolineaceae bacterium]
MHNNSYIALDAQVDPSARIGETCYIGAAAQLGPDVTTAHECAIGARTRLIGSVALAKRVQVGDDCLLIGPLVIGEGSRIGRGVTIGQLTAADVPGFREPYDRPTYPGQAGERYVNGVPPYGPQPIAAFQVQGAGYGAPVTLPGPDGVGEIPVSRIGQHVRIGRGSRIIAGATLEHGACLLPETVLYGNVPENCQAGGDPARLLGVICRCGKMAFPSRSLGAQVYECPDHPNDRIDTSVILAHYQGRVILPGGGIGPYLPLKNQVRQFYSDWDL